ncbi:MAG TPA: hypothetical protein DD624_06880 [Alphaproteobacteria bacterium]|nr:hypothetical protein [Alphaproteobacteria bacterium]
MHATAFISQNESTAFVAFGGDWSVDCPVADRDGIVATFENASFTSVVFSGKKIESWDSALVALLVRLMNECSKHGIDCTLTDMPDGVEPLIKLALAVPPRVTRKEEKKSEPFLDLLGEAGIRAWKASASAFDFMKKAYRSFVRFIRGKAVLRKSDVLWEIQEAGVNALPIVSLICFMVGLIVAFVGSIQLKMFGAQIYVASLVAIAVTRVMGAIMAGVIMAGRTGASYAATIGSMQVNEEVDALETMGISPFDFLITPRLLALSLMMPLLTVYADLMGILGGAFVGIVMLGLSPEEYARMTLSALISKNIIVGIIHGTVFGMIIALCGCYQGLVCGRNASAVGRATTSAVVYSIVWMTVATALLTFFFNLIGV